MGYQEIDLGGFVGDDAAYGAAVGVYVVEALA